MILVENVVKKFTNKKEEHIAVNHITFNISKGEIVGILGSNGAGKSTIIKMMCGLLIPTEGKILVFNRDIKEKNNLIYVLKHASFFLEGQRSIYYYFTLLENIKYFLSLKGIKYNDMKEHISSLINYFGLQNDLNKTVGSYSTGMKQKASVIIALAGNEDIIVLDEPTLGLDVQSSNNLVLLLKKYVKEKRKTVLITCHDMKVVENICSRAIVIEKGKLIFDGNVTKLKNIFEMNQIKIVCKLIDPSKFNDYDMIDNNDGTWLFKIITKKFQIGNIIRNLENKGAIILSIKSNNSDFEKAYINFINKYKVGINDV